MTAISYPARSEGEQLLNRMSLFLNEEPAFIDEVMLHECPYQSATASDQDVLTGLLLQPGHFVYHICSDQP